MNSKIIIITILCSTHLAFATINNKQDDSSSKPFPFDLFRSKFESKFNKTRYVIGLLRERLPKQTIENILPSVIKEIQDNINLAQINNLDTSIMPGVISSIIDKVISKLQPTQSTTPSSSTEQVSVEIKTSTQESTPEQKTGETGAETSPTTPLPDLAFDRDPSRNNPIMDDQDLEDELGHEPKVRHMPPESLGEYDQFYTETFI